MLHREKGNLHLLCDGADQVLVDLRTGGGQELEGSAWKLGFAEGGEGILVDGTGNPHWTADLLQIQLKAGPGGKPLATVAGNDVPHSEFMAEHSLRQVKLQVRGAGACLTEVAVFKRLSFGARAFSKWKESSNITCHGQA